MTIKTKLIANILVTAAIIVGISMASFSSMSFLQEKLSYIAEKSVPFQVRSVEFQREFQSCITDLVKVNAARNMPEYARFSEEAARSLENTKRSGQILEKMNSGNRINVSEELDRIAGELFAATEARLRSENAASKASAKVALQKKESSTRLKELETHIRKLQAAHAASFAKALENTARFSARLRDLEELRYLVKELLSVSNLAHNARNSTAFLIARGKAKTLLGRISGNKNGNFISADLRTLTDDMTEFLQLQAVAVTQKDDDSKKWALEALIALAENMNRMNLALDQEIELASSRLAIESNRQGLIFAQSNSANNILLTNSELVTLGLTVTGEINRLFTLDSPGELAALDSEIRALYSTIYDRAQVVESSLARLDARDEAAILHEAVASLAAIRTGLYSADGIVATLTMKLNAGDQAGRAADKLHAMVLMQSKNGKESVSAAQGEQEKLIIAIHSMARKSLSRIIGIGSVAIVVGVFFGFWIYRSVLLPLRVVLDAVRSQQRQGKEKAELAESVAAGDLSREVSVCEALTLDPEQAKQDEMGMVLSAVVGMSEAQVALDRAFAGMTASLRRSRDEETRRDRLKSGLYELNKILRNEQKTADMTDRALAFMAAFLGAGIGIMYIYDDKEEMLQALSTYAISGSERLDKGFRLGEGLPGQAALERKMICLDSIPPGYHPIASALGEADPLNVVFLPILHHDTLIGVLELGSFRRFDNEDFAFVNQSLEGIAIAIKVNRSRQLVNELLEQSQQQAEELRVQQEELQQTNEELVERARMLAEHQRKMAEMA